MSDILKQLTNVLESRKALAETEPESSYVAGLHAKGINKILEKLGEEAIEAIIAAKDGDKAELIKETADLWFHSLVMLSHMDLSAADVLAELERRFGLSGLDEKASRPE